MHFLSKIAPPTHLPFPSLFLVSLMYVCSFAYLVSLPRLWVWDKGNKEGERDLEFCFSKGNKYKAKIAFWEMRRRSFMSQSQGGAVPALLFLFLNATVEGARKQGSRGAPPKPHQGRRENAKVDFPEVPDSELWR